MMSTVLSSLVSLLLILAGYFFFYRRFSIDRYREELFKLREGLFDLALDSGELSFKSEAYKNFELLINNNIRFAHKISFLSAFFFNALNRLRYPGSPNIQSKVAADFFRQIGSMRPSETKSRIMELKARFETQTIRYLLRTSPLFFVFVSGVVLLFILKQIVQPAKLKSLVKRYLVGEVNREIELQAENYCLASG